MYDVAILGAGPAGMTAAVYCARKQLKILLLTENVGGQALWSSAVENYLGYEYISGADLVAKFEEHLKKFPMEMVYQPAIKVERSGKTFKMTGRDGAQYSARAVIVASGKIPRELGTAGEAEFRGRGITYCATCDAPLFAGKDVAVVGGGNSGLDAAIQLMQLSPKVYVIELGPKLPADETYIAKVKAAPNVAILVNSQIVEISGDIMVEAAKVLNRVTGEERILAVGGIFVEIGLLPNSGPVAGLVKTNERGEIIVDKTGRTSLPGVFAAGDVTDVPDKQIIVAAGEGAKAALSAYDFLIRGE
ncbi:MAG: FAD-dependent oxidoreductase [Actinomycetota bacterium]